MAAAAAAGILPVAADPVAPEVEIASRAAQGEAARDRVGLAVVVLAGDARVDAQIHARGGHAVIALVKKSGNADRNHPSPTLSTRMIRS